MKFEIKPYKKKFVVTELICNNAFWSSGRYCWLFVTESYPSDNVKSAIVFDTIELAQKWIDDVDLNSRRFINLK